MSVYRQVSRVRRTRFNFASCATYGAERAHSRPDRCQAYEVTNVCATVGPYGLPRFPPSVMAARPQHSCSGGSAAGGRWTYEDTGASEVGSAFAAGNAREGWELRAADTDVAGLGFWV